MRTWAKLIGYALLAGALFLQLNCGGGGSASGGGTPPPLSNGALRVVTTSLPDVIEGKPYSQTLQAAGGKAPYSWNLTAGRMPDGISFTNSGLISGTTTWNLQAGDFSFIAEVTDAAGTRATSSWIRLVAMGVFKITTTSFPAGNVGIAYSEGFWATAGTPGYSYSLLSGSLPPGLTLNSGGLISGTPEQSGSFTFTVRGKDSSSPPMTADATFVIEIGNNLGFVTGQELPPAVQYSPYSTTIKAVGGTPPYKWALNEMSWAMPEGLTLDSLTGRISGTPTVSSGWVLQIDVTDSSQPMQKATQPFFLSVRSPLAFRSQYLNDAVVANAYPGWVVVDGGIAPYSLQLINGSLPSGITLQTGTNNYGQFMFSGTPTTLGTSTFTLQATDSQTPPAIVTKIYSLRIIEALKATFPTALPNSLTGQPYSYQFSATGGTPPYSWTVANAPAGVAIDRNTGTMTGTPTAAFDGYVSVTVRDSGQPSQSAYGNPTLHIAGLLDIATSSLPSVVENSKVNLQLLLTGGTGPFSWKVLSGSLPVGLALSTTGAIHGTPTGTGTSSFTVSVSDQGMPAQQATASFSLPVVATPGRNNTIETATPLSNGTYAASISPLADPPSGIASPDLDVYKFTASPGAIVKLEIFAERLTPSSPLDSVIELVDANGTRLKTCNQIGLGMAFNAQCMNDDVWDNSTIDSRLFLQVPGTGSTPFTFYVKVLDFRGDARPDLRYQISANGVN